MSSCPIIMAFFFFPEWVSAGLKMETAGLLGSERIHNLN